MPAARYSSGSCGMYGISVALPAAEREPDGDTALPARIAAMTASPSASADARAVEARAPRA